MTSLLVICVCKTSNNNNNKNNGHFHKSIDSSLENGAYTTHSGTDIANTENPAGRR
jgi:hypothetical protein